jgi:hypothetical protein
VQNKVDPAVARSTLAGIRAAGVVGGWTGTATGIALWHYVDGPWAPIRTVSFRRPSAR